MRPKAEQSLREALKSDGWSDADIATIIEDAEEVEELLMEDECFFAAFMETERENT